MSKRHKCGTENKATDNKNANLPYWGVVPLFGAIVVVLFWWLGYL